jgi:pimeloyl-ACP methyl ester carboxylesterase
MSVGTPARVEAGTVRANGAELYYERRGTGAPVLCISGATGDAGHFTAVADRLADEFTVITYDRRGNSRSKAPVGWASTSMAEQADDVAALLEALECVPAGVFGTSGGGIILLELLIRRPDVVRKKVVHEPPLIAVLPNRDALTAELGAMAGHALASGGPRAALEVFVRVNAGDHTFEHLDEELRDRMLGNAEVLLGVELDQFQGYVPDVAALRARRVPLMIAAGTEHERARYFFVDAAQWLGQQLNIPVTTFPGQHTPYWDRVDDLVAVLRPLLR